MRKTTKIFGILLVVDIMSLLWLFIFGNSVYGSNYEHFMQHLMISIYFSVPLAILFIALWFNDRS